MDQLEFETREPAPGQLVLTMKGVLTISTLFNFREFTNKDKSECLIVDMEQVPFIDSAGLGSMITAYVSREREARKMVLTGVNERVKMMMTVSGVESLFKMYPDVGAAERALA